MRASVVIPARNRSELLIRAVESVLAQEVEGCDVIVVDDGSTDGLAERTRARFGGAVRIHSQEPAGVGAARNAGARLASGELLIFLDSDDEALPGWLPALVEAAEAPDRPALVFCGMREVGPGGSGSELLPEKLGVLFHDTVGLFLAGAFGARRQAFEEVGGYDELLTSAENTELGFRLTDWCAEHAAATTAVPRALVLRHLQVGERLSRDYEKALAGAERILEQHAERLLRAPATKADYHATAAVRAARLGRKERARHHFREAVGADPSSIKHRGRLLLSYLWPLARMKWPGLSNSARD